MARVASQQLIVEFWDVGQGDASVIRFARNHVVLIDVGPRGSPLIDWIITHPSVFIECIVLTHNDADHAGALAAIVDAAKFRIGTVYFLQDRQKKDQRFVRLFSRLDDAFKAKEIRQLRRLEAPDEVWSNPALHATVEVKYPYVSDNIAAAKANVTSGILTLSIRGKVKIIWAGDALIEAVARECAGSRPNYLIGPHHGAPEDRAKDLAQGWLNSIGAETNLISVGSNNKHPHPQPSFIRKSLRAGSRIVCTQLTPLCDKSRKSDVISSHARLALPRPNTGIACRGPVRLTLVGENFLGDELDAEHQEAILDLDRPKCIRLHPDYVHSP